MTKKATWDQNTQIINAIRRTFSRSPIVREILNEGKRTKPRYKKDGTRHKVDAVEYLCQVCNNWVNSTHIEVDHISPVVPVTSEYYIRLDDFVKRLFCDKKNLQRICEECHDKKSKEENAQRRLMKDTKFLDIIEKQLKLVGVSPSMSDSLQKELKKYIKKTKPESIKNRAIALTKELQRSIKK